jgi:hypothetical protein
MRLLKRGDDNELSFTKDLIGDDEIPPYAILSHAWEEGQEVTFDDWISGRTKSKAGYKKILFCAQQAERDRLQHFWVDTCCINKADPVELQDAINSMFRWYQNAAKCYVYLSDVSTTKQKASSSRGLKLTWEPAFRESRWFRRGWTLQELLAPRSVSFFSEKREHLGDKQSLEQQIHEITGIAIEALRGTSLLSFSIDERLQWAKNRQTTRGEDKAYCLLGIFGIFMPLMYGEGKDHAFKRLRDEIDKATESLPERYLSMLPTAEGASFDSHMDEHNSTCLPDTRTELLHHIHGWANDKNSKPIFWLNGAAGTGKSTIARTVARAFADQQQLGASFFFKRGEGERGNATRFFTTIATQLAHRISEFGPGVKKAIEADPAISQKTLKDQFEKLILHPILDVAHPPALVLLIVIDALDECERDSDIRVILQLLSQTRDLKSLSLRVFVTSRPELHIRLGFKKLPDGTFEDLVLHKVAEQTIQHDIRVYFEHELDRVREERSLSGWPSPDQVEALVKQAVPLFIFAATACRYIGDRRDNPKKRLQIVLGYQKAKVSKLDATYLPILNQLFEEEDEEDRERCACEFRDIVGSIVVLQNPLSITSLAHLLGISKDDVSCRLDSLHSVLSIPDGEDMPVRLLHLSFREFLVDVLKKEKSPFWVDEKARHEELASHCLQLMSGPTGLRRNMCDLQPGTLRSEVNERTIKSYLSPELQYACRYWVDHLEQSQRLISNEATTATFLQKHFLHWLEAMSLLGDTNKCVPLLETFSTLVEVRILFLSYTVLLTCKTVIKSSNSALSAFLHDAQRFTLRFRHILQDAPLQIYSSTLIFAPEASIVRKAFVNEMPARITSLSKREDNWDACRSVLEGHTDGVLAVVFSPDGQLVASASYDNTARVWEAATGSCRSVLKGHTSWVVAIVFSPDGQLVASASHDNTVQVWEAATGSCRSVLEGHTDGVRAVVFSPDGQLVASASDDMTVRVWEAATGSCRSVLKGHTDWVRAVVFSPDGQLVASASDDMTVRVWEAATGSCRSVFEGHTHEITAVVFSPDGQLVASASEDKTVQVWEGATGSCRSVLESHTDGVRAVVFSPDGQYIRTNCGDIPLHPPTTPSPSFQRSQPSPIFVQDQWISLHLQRTLWLPSEYRPMCTTVNKNVVCLGQSSGRIMFFKFCIT